LFDFCGAECAACRIEAHQGSSELVSSHPLPQRLRLLCAAKRVERFGGEYSS
jgi:hypothetical protein